MALRLLADPIPTTTERSGSLNPLEALWDTWGARIQRLVQRTLGPDQGTEDLVHEAFVRLLQKVGTLRDSARIEGFVVAITLNVVRLELRRRKRWRAVAPTDRADPSISGSAEDAVAVKRLFVLLDQLEPDQRLAFTLRYIEQLELTEVAEAMGLSLATAKRRLAEAKAFLEEKANGDAQLHLFVKDPHV